MLRNFYYNLRPLWTVYCFDLSKCHMKHIPSKENKPEYFQFYNIRLGNTDLGLRRWFIGEILNTTLSLNLNLPRGVSLSITTGKSAFLNRPERSICGGTAAPSISAYENRSFLAEWSRQVSGERFFTPSACIDGCSAVKKLLPGVFGRP